MLLLTNIGQLLTLRGPAGPRRGTAMLNLEIVTDAAVLCSGKAIIAAGPRREVMRSVPKRLREVDCGKRTVIPGFVDSHTHPVFAAARLVDFEQRIAGATYQQIAERGGGIRSSVDAVRETSRAALARHVASSLEAMNRHGSTTIETKSGYGLDLKSEIKSLQAIRDAAAVFSGTVVSTLLGAHVVPHDFADNRDEYIRIVCDEMIPAAAKRPPRRAGRTARTANGQSQTAECESSLASFVDVFCERSAFTLEETRRIFSAARQHGLGIRIHLGQLSETPLADLLQFDPASFDHMNHIRDADLPRLAKSNSVVTLLPGADYFLATPYASARKFIDAAVAVALATDFNPGTSPTLSMPMVLSLACTQMRMSPAEAITAATINGAAALRLASSKGSIEAGKDADLAIFDVPDYREIPYWFGQNRCWAVVTLGHFQQVK